MTMRINYPVLGKDNLRHLHSLREALAATPTLPSGLRALVELRVSQLNGCAYCCDLHAHEARDVGVPQQALDVLPAWREAPAVFDEATRAALDWAERVTVLGEPGPDDVAFEAVSRHFSEQQVVDLTLATVLTNAYNRLAVAFHNQPASRPD